MSKKIAGIFVIIVIISINIWLVNYAPPDISEHETRSETIIEDSITTTTSNSYSKNTTTTSYDDEALSENVDEKQSSNIEEESSLNTKQKESTSTYVKSYKGIVNIASALLCVVILFDMFRPSKTVAHTTNIGTVIYDNTKTEHVDIKDSVIQRSNIGGESNDELAVDSIKK